MSSVVISGDTSGTVTLAAPAVAGSNTITMQAATATMSVNTLSTAVASTSGTSIDFTGIPSWAKRVTVLFSSVSTSGTASFLIQLGVSGTPVTSGYVGGGMRGTSTVTGAYFTTGFGFNTSSATTLYGGSLVITNVTGNTWCATGVLGGDSSTAISIAGGSVALSGVLNMVRITTSNGTDTFDSGTINLLYEG